MRFKTGEVITAQPTWWLYGADNTLVAWAGDTFATRSQAEHAAEEFRYQAARARFELFQDRQGRWRWRAVLRDDKIASSSEVFPSEIAARRAANAVRDTVASATPVHGGPPALRRTAD
jgi:uncharacterized protein YegP (UPF0339 family)